MVGIIVIAAAFSKILIHKFGGDTDHDKGKRGKAGEGRSASLDASAKQHIELEKLRLAERKEARETFERLVQAKLDVIKTAVTMGQEDEDLARLDARLERLVGEDKLKQLMEGREMPTLDTDLLDTDLDAEVERLRRQRESA